ncbi:MAG: glycosyltransferase family 39 protein [Rhodobacteraceae bacterium]|nr:glycosyltransferase family 39 protein [Paracoccaceae bacterium]
MAGADTPGTDGAKAGCGLLIILALSFALKLVLVTITPIGIDEAYGIAVGRSLSLSFFDHPPLSFWAPGIAARLSGIEHPLVYRAPFLIAGLVTTWAMYAIGVRLGGVRVGLWTAGLYAIAPFFVISTGVLIVPDGPLALFSALTVLSLVRIAGHGDRAPMAWWLLAGLTLALALMSKYQAAWIPVAVLVFMLINPRGRRWFGQAAPWLGVLVGLLGLLPVLVWNLQHGWISFTFHGSRAGGGMSADNILRMLVFQAIFLLPTGLLAVLIGIRLAFRRPVRPEVLLLAIIALGPVLIFNVIYLTSRGSFAHWAMPGWQFALPLAGLWLAGLGEATARRFRNWAGGFAIAIWLPVLLLVIHAQTGFLTRPFTDAAPDWDRTEEVFNLGGLRPGLEARGLWQEADLLMAADWVNGGLVDTATGAVLPMRIADLRSAHHFVFMEGAAATGTALLLEPSRLKLADQTAARLLGMAQAYDANAEILPPVILNRGGVPYVAVAVVRLQMR